jgi:hypothetical protein
MPLNHKERHNYQDLRILGFVQVVGSSPSGKAAVKVAPNRTNAEDRRMMDETGLRPRKCRGEVGIDWI